MARSGGDTTTHTLASAEQEGVLQSAWRCRCARCGHRWVALCDCRTVSTAGAVVPALIHRLHCEPPERCSSRQCKSRAWNRQRGKPGRPPGSGKGSSK